MMAEVARARLFEEIAHVAPERRDLLLDLYIRWRDGATEWDAELWGFDPDDWMWDERQEMERRDRHGHH